jgi:hypothetical protein
MQTMANDRSPFRQRLALALAVALAAPPAFAVDAPAFDVPAAWKTFHATAEKCS